MWTERRMILHVRGDSVAMLTVVLKMKPTASTAMGLIAREVALDVAESAFQPDVRATHLPGVANTLADALSRRADPAKMAAWTVPVACWRSPVFSSSAR